MKLVIITAFFAVCGAAKLDRTYLPPSSAATAGGSPGSLQTPLVRSSEQGLETPKLPIGSYSNNFEGVVVDAAAPGTRASADALSNLGGPRQSYGSTDSKVGEAAFRGTAGFRGTTFGGQSSVQSDGSNIEANQQNTQFTNRFSSNQFSSDVSSQGFENKSERPQAAKDRNSNILALSNDVDTDRYSYGFETDNGIAVGENGVAVNGIQAEGGYSYEGDDGQVYKVTYVADEGGYRPQGSHLPTPPPIPEEILKSIEQNAKEEAAGIVDDGSYDAQKYNAEGDYTNDNSGNNRYNGGQLSLSGKRPQSDASPSGTFINQNGQAFRNPELNHQSSNQQNMAFGQFSQTNGANAHLDNAALQNDQSNFNRQTFNGNSAFGQFNSQSMTSGQSSQNSNTPLVDLNKSEFNKQASQSFNQLNLSQNQNTQAFFNGQRNQENEASNSVSSLQPNEQFSGNAHTFTQTSGNQVGSLPTKGQTTFGFQNQFGSQATASAQVNDFAPNSQDTQRHQNFNTQYNSQSSKPSFGQISPNSQTRQQVGTSTGQVQSSNNQFNFKNEYLPPNAARKQQEQENINGFNFNSQFGTRSNNNNLNRQTPSSASTSASTSFGQSSQTQPSRSQNAFDSQTSTTPSKPNKFVQQNSFNQQNQYSSSRPSQFNSNFQQTGSSSQTVQEESSSDAKPTSVPSTELTTPLEPNETSENSQRAQVSSQTTSNIGSFDSKPVANTQGQAQFGFQGNFAFRQSSQIPSVPTSSPALTQTPQAQPVNNYSFGQPQPSQNNFNQKNEQNIDDSYYYNQPATPFGQRPQEPRFPSIPTYQSNIMTSQSTFNNQNSFSGNGNLPNSQSLAPVSPTAATQFSQQQNFNGITQAAISPFPSPSPAPSQFGQRFGSKPTFNQPFGNAQAPKPVFNQQNMFNNQFQTGRQQNKPAIPQVNNSGFPSQPSQFSQTSSFGFQSQNKFEQSQNTPTSTEQPSEEQTSLTQQYQGTIYEYNKPPQVLPAPSQSDSSSSQTIQSGFVSNPDLSQTNNQFSSQQNQAITDSKDLSNNKPFGIAPTKQSNQVNQNQAANQFSQNKNQFANTPASENKPTNQFPLSSSQQNVQGSQAINPFGTNDRFLSNQNPQENKSSQINQPSRGSQSQFGLSNFGNTATAQNNGYFYPSPVTKFSENTQSVQPQSNVNIQNQFAQSQIDSKPQFGNPTSQLGQNSGFGQRIQQIGQSTAYSQAVASGQASASASASSTPQRSQYKPFGLQNRNQFGLTQSQQSPKQIENQNLPSTENLEADDLKPFGALSSRSQPMSESQASELPKPIFNSACCQPSKDSIPAQSSDSPSQTSFEGSQNFNSQSFAGKGEQFSGPRDPPKFDETGYHY